MSQGRPGFAFPAHMPAEAAQELLAETYRAVDAGKVLRRALKEQRAAGLDPPGDVQYVCEPRVEAFEDGLGVGLHSDVLAHDAFEGMEECVDIFEAVLAEALLDGLEKRVHRWLQDHPAPTASGK